MTYHKVKTIIAPSKSTMFYDGTIESETKPKDIFTHTPRIDIYVDYFESEDEAREFVDGNKENI